MKKLSKIVMLAVLAFVMTMVLALVAPADVALAAAAPEVNPVFTITPVDAQETITYDGEAHVYTAYVVQYNGITLTLSTTNNVVGSQVDIGGYVYDFSITSAVLKDVTNGPVDAYEVIFAKQDESAPDVTVECKNQELTISHKAVEVTVDAGQGKIYGDAENSLQATVTGLANGDDADDIIYTISREAGENVGE